MPARPGADREGPGAGLIKPIGSGRHRPAGVGAVSSPRICQGAGPSPRFATGRSLPRAGDSCGGAPGADREGPGAGPIQPIGSGRHGPAGVGAASSPRTCQGIDPSPRFATGRSLPRAGDSCGGPEADREGSGAGPIRPIGSGRHGPAGVGAASSPRIFQGAGSSPRFATGRSLPRAGDSCGGPRAGSGRGPNASPALPWHPGGRPRFPAARYRSSNIRIPWPASIWPNRLGM